MAAGPAGGAGLPGGGVGALVRRDLAALVCAGGVVIVALAGTASAAGDGNLHDVPPDLVVPIAVEGEPAPGKRVFAVAPGWEGTAVRHTLALPRDWRPGVRLPVLVEYPGNGPYRSALGDVSEGTPEGCVLGHGLAGRPVWISHELDVEATRRFLDTGRVLDGAPARAFAFVPIPYPNHSAAWVLRDLPQRARARAWLRDVVGPQGE